MAKFVLFFLAITFAIAVLATMVRRHVAARRAEGAGFLGRVARTWVVIVAAAIALLVIWLILELTGLADVLSEAIN